MSTLSPRISFPKIFWILYLTALPVLAQTSGEAVSPDTLKSNAVKPDSDGVRPRPNVSAQKLPGGRTESTAYWLATGGTLFTAVPVVGWVFGPTIGPSLGEIYARSPGTALFGIGTRTVGVGLYCIGLDEDVFLSGTGSGLRFFVGNRWELGGLIVWAGGTLFSFVDTHYIFVRAKETPGIPLSFDFSPTLMGNGDGTQRVGMTAKLGF